MSLSPTQLSELQTIVEALRGEFPNSDDAVWQGAIRIQKGGLGPVTGGGGQAAFDTALAEIVICADQISTVQGRQGGPGSSLDEAIFQVVPVEDNLPAGSVGDVIYIDMAPNVYLATGVISLVPAGPNSVTLAEIGTDVARTVPAASGGLEVNNLSTGVGFERVLTTADSQAHNAEFVTMALSANIPNERVLTAGTDISIVDGGAGGNVTINADSQNPFATPLGILGDINLPDPPLDSITSLLEFRDLADAVVAGHVGMAGQFGRLELSNFIEGRILRLTTAEGGSDNDDAGGIEILAGQGETPNGSGGDVDIRAGFAGTGGTGSGGAVQLRAGSSGSTAGTFGGAIQLIAGQGGGGGAGNTGGGISFSAGGGGGSDSNGGEIRSTAGAGSRDGGNIILIAGIGGTGQGGNVDITSGQSGGVALPSGDIILEVNDVTGGASGNVFINTRTGIGPQGGSVESSQDPGLVAIYGVNVNTNINAGNVEIWGGYANGNQDTSVGGDVILFGGGGGGGPPQGGDVKLFGGNADENPGDVEITGGTCTVSGPGGLVIITGGDAFNSGPGGIVSIDGGVGVALGAGGEVQITGGFSGSGATGNGGDVQLRGGQAVSTNGLGGDIDLSGGAGSGSGADGVVRVSFGQIFRIQNLGGGDYVEQSHDGQDFNWVGVNTQDFNLSGFTGEFALRDFSVLNLFDGLFIRLHDASNSDSVDLIHNGTDLTLTGFQTDNFRLLGGSMRLVVRASTTTRAGLNIPEGVAPSSPDDGDVWITAAGGYFARLNGVSVDLAATSGQVNSVVSGTNITIDASDPVNPIANLDAAITGVSVNAVTLSAAGAATDYLDETGAYSVPAGAIAISGSPVNNQLAVWTGAATLEGEAAVTFTGVALIVDGEVHVDIDPGSGGLGLFMQNGGAGTEIFGITATGAGGIDFDFTNVSVVNFNGGDIYDFSNELIRSVSTLQLQERAAANSDIAGQGQVWVRDDTPNTLMFADDTGNEFVVSGFSVAREKSSTETTNNDIVLSDDSELTMTLPIGTYRIHLIAFLSANTTGGMGIQYRLNFTGSIARTRFMQQNRINNADAQRNATFFNQSLNYATITTTGASDYLDIEGIAVITVAGTLSFQWAQQSSNANNLAINNASSLTAQLIRE